MLRAYEALDTIATAAGQLPLEGFDERADVPADVVAQRAEEAMDIPDLSDFPVVWHDPADAVAILDAILSALASPDRACADEDPEELADCLEAFRQALQQAATRKTWFNFTIVRSRRPRSWFLLPRQRCQAGPGPAVWLGRTVGLSQPSHGLVERHRTWVPWPDTQWTLTSGNGRQWISRT